MDQAHMASPLVFVDGLACGPDLLRLAERGCVLDPDRRRTVRIALPWTVYLFRDRASHPLESRTKDISSTGFYCFARDEFAVGEAIRFSILIPTFSPERPADRMCLDGQAEVVRVEPLSAGNFGVACQVKAYKIVATGVSEGYVPA